MYVKSTILPFCHSSPTFRKIEGGDIVAASDSGELDELCSGSDIMVLYRISFVVSPSRTR